MGGGDGEGSAIRAPHIIYGGIMAAEKVVLVRRTVYVAEHPQCEFKDVRDANPPREIQCPVCKNWIEFEEHIWEGTDEFVKGGLKSIR